VLQWKGIEKETGDKKRGGKVRYEGRKRGGGGGTNCRPTGGPALVKDDRISTYAPLTG